MRVYLRKGTDEKVHDAHGRCVRERRDGQEEAPRRDEREEGADKKKRSGSDKDRRHSSRGKKRKACRRFFMSATRRTLGDLWWMFVSLRRRRRKSRQPVGWVEGKGTDHADRPEEDQSGQALHRTRKRDSSVIERDRLVDS